MRSVPEARRSKFNHFRQLWNRVHDCVTLKRLKRRWNIHKIKKGSRKTTYRSAVPIDRVGNIPTGMSHKSANGKPLLIVSFNKGQSNSPKVRILEQNGYLRSRISGRQYKLKRVVNNASVIRDTEHMGQHTVRQEVARHADLKVNKKYQGIVKTTDIPCCYVDEPKLINVGQEHTLRIRDYPSLNPNNGTKLKGPVREKQAGTLSNLFNEDAFMLT